MRSSWVVALGAVVVCSGCIHLVPPPGAAPLRFRDPVFKTVNVTNDLVYGSAADQRGVVRTLKLDLYQPVSDTSTARPAIVWVHGGGFVGGTKTASELVDQATVFSKRGYVNVSIDYRLGPKDCNTASDAVCTESIKMAQYDAQAAVRWLRAKASLYKIDSSRIAIGGSSAGAITALNVGFNPGDVGASGSTGFASDVAVALSLSGARVRGTADVGDAASLMFHGTADTQVLYAWALSTQVEALAAGLSSILTSWEGDGHLPYGKHRQEILDQSTNFMYWTMDLEHAAQS